MAHALTRARVWGAKTLTRATRAGVAGVCGHYMHHYTPLQTLLALHPLQALLALHAGLLWWTSGRVRAVRSVRACNGPCNGPPGQAAPGRKAKTITKWCV